MRSFQWWSLESEEVNVHSNRLPPSCCFISENSSIKINLCLVKYRLAISKPTTSRPGVNSVKEDPVWKCVVRRLRAKPLNRLGWWFCWRSVCQALVRLWVQSPGAHQPCMLLHSCSPSMEEVKAGGREIQVILGCMVSSKPAVGCL